MTVIVTGATGGLGRCLTRRLVEHGCPVAALGRSPERLAALATEVGAAPRLLTLPVDLRDPAAVRTAFAAVEARLGPVTVLINNAGLGHDAPLIRDGAEAWRDMLEVNVLGLSLCTALALEQMRANGDRGHVVHVSSLAAYRVAPHAAFYSATKQAVRCLTEGLRLELRAAGSRIRVSSVSPGFIATDFPAKFFGDAAGAARYFGDVLPLSPDDVWQAIAHILTAPEHVEVHDIVLRPIEQRS